MGLRDDLRATRNAAAVPLRPVPTPEWPTLDGKLFVMALSAFDVDRLFSDSAKDDDGNDRAKFVCRVTCDADRSRVLEDDDAMWIAHKEAAVIERLYWAGREVNGLTEESRKLARKNSPPEERDGSPSSSAEPSTPVLAST